MEFGRKTRSRSRTSISEEISSTKELTSSATEPSKKPIASRKEPSPSAKEPTASTKEPTSPTKKPTSSAKEPTASAKEPTSSGKEATRGLGMAGSSHSITKSTSQAKSRKPILEKWTVSPSSSSSSTSSSQQIIKPFIKNQGLAKMAETFIISKLEPRVGQEVEVMSDGKISRGKVIKTCPVGYLVHYEGWSVMFDEWIKTFKSSKAVAASEVVANGNSGAKPKQYLNGGAKDIKIIEIEDDNSASVQNTAGNNNSPLIPVPKARPGRPSKSQSQIQQSPITTNKAAPAFTKRSQDTQEKGVLIQTRNQERRASLPQAGNITKKELVQEKISVSGTRYQEKTADESPTPQPRNSEKRTSMQLTKVKDKKLLEQEERNKEKNSPIPRPRTNLNEKQSPVPQPRNLVSDNKVQESKNTFSNKKSVESPKVMPRKIYTTNSIENVSNDNGVSKAKGNIWITNKDLGNKNVFKNVKHETSGGDNKNNPPKNIPYNGQNGRSISSSFDQGQSKRNQGLGDAIPLVFRDMADAFRETVDSTDDDDLSCNASPTCMGSFWYMSELHSHLKSAHGIQDPDSFCRKAREKKWEKMFSKEVKGKEPKQEEESKSAPNHDNTEKNMSIPNDDKTKNGNVSINLISPENQTKSKTLSYTKVVSRSSKKTISKYEQIREDNIKEKQDLFEKLGIKETKDALTPARRNSKTGTKKSTPSNKTKSVKRVLSSAETSETNESESVRKSSRLKRKPNLNYSDINDPDSNSDMNYPDSNSDLNELEPTSDIIEPEPTSDMKEPEPTDSDSKDGIWIEKEVITPKKKRNHSSHPQDIWIVKEIETPKKPKTDPLEDKEPAWNKALARKDEKKEIKHSSFKSVTPQKQTKKQENLKNVNNLKNLVPKLSTTEDAKGEDSEDGGYTCNIDGCLESFWYENQLFEHMAYTHD